MPRIRPYEPLDPDNPEHMKACRQLCELVALRNGILPDTLEQAVEETIEFEMDGLTTYDEAYRQFCDAASKLTDAVCV